MRFRNLILAIGVILVFGSLFTSAQGSFFEGGARFSGGGSFASSVTYQSRPSFQAIYGPEDRFRTYWPILGDRDTCEARQDLLLQVAPLGCQPSVVRSDLLAEQNVPVFCQIDAFQMNPLIDIKKIRNIGFSRVGGYPKEIVGTGFHPARAALRTRDRLLGSPLINNIGYVVVVLKKTEDEKKLPDSVKVDLTARLDFEAGNAYGIGRAEFILSPMSDEEWERERFKNSFWNGRYFVRVENADADFAIISLYLGDRKISTMRVKRGESSAPVYVPGAYCRAGIQASYDGFTAARKKAKIEISNQEGTDVVELYEGSSFLNGKCRVNKIDVSNDNFGNVSVRCSGESNRGEILLGLRPGINASNESLSDEDLGGELEREFNDALRNYEIIAEDYPAERQAAEEGAKIFAEEALAGAIELTKYVESDLKKKKSKTRYGLLNKYQEIYPNGVYSEKYEKELREIFEKDTSRSGGVVNVDNNFYTIRLLELDKPSKNSSAEVRILGHRTYDIQEENEREINYSSIKKIRLERVVDVESVEITPFCWVGSKENRQERAGSRIRLRLGEEPVVICESERISLENVELEKVVKIRLNPLSQGTRIETNLSVSIGIEKRAIKLSEEKTDEIIENLNKSIEKWGKINEGLGKVVTGLKSACFATAGVLTVKNFFDGIGGGAIARKQAMEGPSGWKQRCKNAIDLKQINRGDGKIASVDYRTMTECFNAEKSHIEAEISARTSANERVNNAIREIEDSGGIKTGDALSGYSVDEPRAMGLYLEKLKREFPEDEVLKNLEPPAGDGSAPYTYADLRAIHSNLLLKREMESKGIGANYVNSDYAVLKEKIDENKRILDEYKTRASAGGLIGVYEVDVRGEAEIKEAGFIELNEDVRNKIEGKEKIASSATHAVIVSGYNRIDSGKPTGRETYMIVGQKQAGELVPSGIYEIKESGGTTVIEDADVKVNDFLSYNKVKKFEDVRTDLFGNSINSNDKKIRFFEVGPDKGLPAIVPFDVVNGWYAKVESNLRVGNQLAAYDKSGLPRTWKICNVGENKAIDLSDNCQLVQQGYSGSILGLELRQSQKLIRDSQNALLDAASQYGEKVIRIGNQEFYQGAPVTPFDFVQCQDYMSIEDCKILFNVCDPVICPASRCDFGGEFPVSDVIQTGIAGSALLCLPNYREGIIAPVCLTGIHAGIDGYLSIMKNYRDCLSESLETGRLVGICDELYSIYMCEFFWRQAAPVANILIPKAVELATGKVSAARGGGEYLNVINAWDNAGKSVDYFTQSYAVNSLKAFRLRDSASVGTEFCRAFVSAKGPDSFKSLVEPESPPQFHAWFSSTTYSDVTVPPTAQYKVFYHIFAGNDVGTQFNVYLKSPPDSSYYYNVPTILVASGFAGRGQYASETKEFTAPEGYRELCVRVNDKEECGFGQVSTSFALDYLSDKFASEKITESGIDSELECVSGSRSLANVGASASPNIQATFEGSVFPDDAKRGIVRICATRNPGSNTEPTRYSEVGNCGDVKMKCWLDKRSVENAISDSNKGVRDETLKEIEEIQIKKLEESGEIFTRDEAQGKIREYGEKVNKKIKELNALAEVGEKDLKDVEFLTAENEKILEKLYFNHHKAEILLLKARLREAFVKSRIRGIAEDRVNADVNVDSGGAGAGAGDAGAESKSEFVLSIEYNKDSIINVIEKSSGAESVVLSIEQGKIYTPDKVLIGNVKLRSGGDYEVQLIDSDILETFYNYLQGRDSGILIGSAEKYFKFKGAIIKGKEIRLSSGG